MKQKKIKIIDNNINTVLFKNKSILFFKGDMLNITLNKEYKITNQIRCSNFHILGFLDDADNHCCFYLKDYDGDVKLDIEVN